MRLIRSAVILNVIATALSGGFASTPSVEHGWEGTQTRAEISAGGVKLRGGSVSMPEQSLSNNLSNSEDSGPNKEEAQQQVPPAAGSGISGRVTPTSEFLRSRGVIGVIHPIRADDVAEFLVADARAWVDPPGWALVGEPARFSVEAKSHIAVGMLLDKPAQVRFTPVASVWDYGDRSAGRSARGNRADRPAQHIYRAAGTYVAAVIVHYSADYKYDDETVWTPVAGLVAGTPAPVSLTVHNARARLIKNQ